VSKKKDFPSELRFNVASQDWVVIATGRAKRPDTFKKEAKKIERTKPEDCPFCNIKSQDKPTLIFAEGKQIKADNWDNLPENWTTVSFRNKFPAFSPKSELKEKTIGGLYKKMNAVGVHEVVVTRDHDQPMGNLAIERIEELIEVYYLRYKDLASKDFVKYIAIFQNHGPEAGASVYHPHSQIISTPLIDTDLKTALLSSKKYYQEKKKCVYCEMGKWELRKKKRIVFENKDFFVLCPFASKTAFEMIISPKKHSAYFQDISKKERKSLAECFKNALGKLYRGLGNPAYNFYLHSAPCDKKDYSFYHWHWTILPKTAVHAGFELGAEMEISVIEPEKAADYLRKQ